MRFYEKLYNRHLVNELRNEINTDILLFLADGSTFYGHLQGLDDCRAAIMTPATCSTNCDVELISDGGCILTTDFTRVCLSTLVARGSGISGDPVSAASAYKRQDSDEAGLEMDRDCGYLHRQLQRLIGDRTVITTVGGFAFEGILSSVCSDIIILTVDTICLPNCCTEFDSNRVRSVIINMNAITSFGSSNCCKPTTNCSGCSSCCMCQGQ